MANLKWKKLICTRYQQAFLNSSQRNVITQGQTISVGKYRNNKPKSNTSKDTKAMSTSGKKYTISGTGKNVYKCIVCNKDFSRPSSLGSHFRIHGKEGLSKCIVNNERNENARQKSPNRSMRAELQNPFSSTGQYYYKCDMCHKVFSNSSSLGSHFKIHAQERLLKCKINKEKFNNAQANNLEGYISKYTKAKLFIEKKYSFSNNVKTLYRCDICNKVFSSSSGLGCHFRLHTRERLFKCKINKEKSDNTQETNLPEKSSKNAQAKLPNKEKPPSTSTEENSLRCDTLKTSVSISSSVANNIEINVVEPSFKKTNISETSELLQKNNLQENFSKSAKAEIANKEIHLFSSTGDNLLGNKIVHIDSNDSSSHANHSAIISVEQPLECTIIKGKFNDILKRILPEKSLKNADEKFPNNDNHPFSIQNLLGCEIINDDTNISSSYNNSVRINDNHPSLIRTTITDEFNNIQGSLQENSFRNSKARLTNEENHPFSIQNLLGCEIINDDTNVSSSYNNSFRINDNQRSLIRTIITDESDNKQKRILNGTSFKNVEEEISSRENYPFSIQNLLRCEIINKDFNNSSTLASNCGIKAIEPSLTHTIITKESDDVQKKILQETSAGNSEAKFPNPFSIQNLLGCEILNKNYNISSRLTSHIGTIDNSQSLKSTIITQKSNSIQKKSLSENSSRTVEIKIPNVKKHPFYIQSLLRCESLNDDSRHSSSLENHNGINNNASSLLCTKVNEKTNNIENAILPKNSSINVETMVLNKKLNPFSIQNLLNFTSNIGIKHKEQSLKSTIITDKSYNLQMNTLHENSSKNTKTSERVHSFSIQNLLGCDILSKDLNDSSSLTSLVETKVAKEPPLNCTINTKKSSTTQKSILQENSLRNAEANLPNKKKDSILSTGDNLVECQVINTNLDDSSSLVSDIVINNKEQLLQCITITEPSDNMPNKILQEESLEIIHTNVLNDKHDPMSSIVDNLLEFEYMIEGSNNSSSHARNIEINSKEPSLTHKNDIEKSDNIHKKNVYENTKVILANEKNNFLLSRRENMLRCETLNKGSSSSSIHSHMEIIGKKQALECTINTKKCDNIQENVFHEKSSKNTAKKVANIKNDLFTINIVNLLKREILNKSSKNSSSSINHEIKTIDHSLNSFINNKMSDLIQNDDSNNLLNPVRDNEINNKEPLIEFTIITEPSDNMQNKILQKKSSSNAEAKLLNEKKNTISSTGDNLLECEIINNNTNSSSSSLSYTEIKNKEQSHECTIFSELSENKQNKNLQEKSMKNIEATISNEKNHPFLTNEKTLSQFEILNDDLTIISSLTSSIESNDKEPLLKSTIIKEKYNNIQSKILHDNSSRRLKAKLPKKIKKPLSHTRKNLLKCKILKKRKPYLFKFIKSNSSSILVNRSGSKAKKNLQKSSFKLTRSKIAKEKKDLTLSTGENLLECEVINTNSGDSSSLKSDIVIENKEKSLGCTTITESSDNIQNKILQQKSLETIEATVLNKKNHSLSNNEENYLRCEILVEDFNISSSLTSHIEINDKSESLKSTIITQKSDNIQSEILHDNSSSNAKAKLSNEKKYPISSTGDNLLECEIINKNSNSSSSSLSYTEIKNIEQSPECIIISELSNNKQKKILREKCLEIKEVTVPNKENQPISTIEKKLSQYEILNDDFNVSISPTSIIKNNFKENVLKNTIIKEKCDHMQRKILHNNSSRSSKSKLSKKIKKTFSRNCKNVLKSKILKKRKPYLCIGIKAKKNLQKSSLKHSRLKIAKDSTLSTGDNMLGCKTINRSCSDSSSLVSDIVTNNKEQLLECTIITEPSDKMQNKILQAQSLDYIEANISSEKNHSFPNSESNITSSLTSHIGINDTIDILNDNYSSNAEANLSNEKKYPISSTEECEVIDTNAGDTSSLKSDIVIENKEKPLGCTIITKSSDNMQNKILQEKSLENKEANVPNDKNHSLPNNKENYLRCEILIEDFNISSSLTSHIGINDKSESLKSTTITQKSDNIQSEILHDNSSSNAKATLSNEKKYPISSTGDNLLECEIINKNSNNLLSLVSDIGLNNKEQSVDCRAITKSSNNMQRNILQNTFSANNAENNKDKQIKIKQLIPLKNAKTKLFSEKKNPFSSARINVNRSDVLNIGSSINSSGISRIIKINDKQPSLKCTVNKKKTNNVKKKIIQEKSLKNEKPKVANEKKNLISGENLYKCVFCNKGFERLSWLGIHFKEHVKEQSNNIQTNVIHENSSKNANIKLLNEKKNPISSTVNNLSVCEIIDLDSIDSSSVSSIIEISDKEPSFNCTTDNEKSDKTHKMIPEFNKTKKPIIKLLNVEKNPISSTVNNLSVCEIIDLDSSDSSSVSSIIEISDKEPSFNCTTDNEKSDKTHKMIAEFNKTKKPIIKLLNVEKNPISSTVNNLSVYEIIDLDSSDSSSVSSIIEIPDKEPSLNCTTDDEKSDKIHKMIPEFNKTKKINVKLLNVEKHTHPNTGESLLYKCNICNKGFTHSSSLADHLRDHKQLANPQGDSEKSSDKTHENTPLVKDGQTKAPNEKNHQFLSSEDNLYKCGVCNRVFTHLLILKSHLGVHSKEKLFKCNVCPKTFNFESNHIVHQNLHTQQKSIEYNRAKFKLNSTLRAHQKSHSSCGEGLSCVVGNKILNDLSSVLPDGQTTPSGGEVKRKRPRRKTSVKLAASVVETSHEEDSNVMFVDVDEIEPKRSKDSIKQRVYRGKICTKALSSNSTLDNHMKTHDQERLFKCNVCSKSFAYESNLITHQSSHAQEKTFQCDTLFKQSSNLNFHQSTQTGQKPYQCTECSKEFNRQSSLETHQKQHTGEKPLKCKLCEKTFKNQSTLKCHTNKKHPA